MTTIRVYDPDRWLHLLAQAADQWVRDNDVRDRLATTENGFLVHAERATATAIVEYEKELELARLEQAEEQAGLLRTAASQRAALAGSRGPRPQRSAITRYRHDHPDLVGGGRHFVYRFWCGVECLYVGVTSNLLNRLAGHELRFGAAVEEVETIEFDCRSRAEQFEADEIRRLRPLHNRAGNPDYA